MLRKLSLEGLLEVAEVDVGVNRADEWLDRYNLLCEELGERVVPIIVIEMKLPDHDSTTQIYLLPKKFEVHPEVEGAEDFEDLDWKVFELERVIRGDLKRAEPVPELPPTHRAMRWK